MYYRKLGNTGLEVSEISFGTIPILQGNIPVLPAYFNLDESEALAVMTHAFRWAVTCSIQQLCRNTVMRRSNLENLRRV